jgi:hypothetical protein
MKKAFGSMTTSEEGLSLLTEMIWEKLAVACSKY